MSLDRGPTYRWWGRVNPQGRQKPPIRAEAPPVTTGADGTAVLRLYDPIDSWGDWWGTSAKEFASALDALPAGTPRIELHINSPGGEVFEAITILNMLRQHPAQVTAVVDGLAASAASFLAAGADELVMGRNSTLMIHDAWGIAIGPAADMRSMADLLDQISDNVAGIYAAKAGSPVEQWRAAMLAETWYSPQQALDAGLADSIQEPAAADGSAAAASWDLSVYSRPAPPVPAPQAPGPVEPQQKFDPKNVAEALRGAFTR